MIHFTSDLHYFHKNVIRFDNRPFKDIEEMNYMLTNNINDCVAPSDELYILGDFAFSDSGNVKKILSQYNCKNLHYVFGNHDKPMRQPDVAKFFKTMSEYKEIAYEGQRIVLHHYPYLEWNAGHYGSWALHGHCHHNLVYPDSLKNKKILDVGVCGEGYNYSPISFNFIKNYMKNKENIIHGNN